MVATSEQMQKYFDDLQAEVNRLHAIATKSRGQGYDPADAVEVKLAANMAERVVGLISVVAPQIVDSGVVERIIELEKEFGILDWRVAFSIAKEVAEQKFCSFKDKKEAMEVGIRTGFAYVTVGVVSSPLDGIVNVEIKNRLDGKGEYVCVNYAGPIRNAGGTAAAVSVLITDYVRKALGYAAYDANPDETKRAITELRDYHERVTNLQYFPSEGEVNFLMPNLPVEVSGDASEKFEVSNQKDLPRIPTNQIRSGYCLVLSSCIPLKAPKLWKQLSKWGADFGMDNWNFLEEFLAIQKKAKAAGKKDTKKSSDVKISPDYTYITDIVAGRPVIGHPLRPGSLRLRYGRSRVSGFSAQSMHPASMVVLNEYIAIGTQLKTERPGKAASMTICDTLEGPVVKLDDDSVVRIDTYLQAKELAPRVKEILFLGDTLIAYGDFFNRAHALVPPGYCEEWWAEELRTAELDDRMKELVEDPLMKKPTVEEAFAIAEKTKTPLHPMYTPYWNRISVDQLKELIAWLEKGTWEGEKLTIPMGPEKRLLELIGVPHSVNNGSVVIGGDEAKVLQKMMPKINPSTEAQSPVEALNESCAIQQRDRCGTFIGARMGRPEKGKQRLLTGNPHVLFPVGNEGGRLRSFQSALDAKKVTADFPFFYCTHCDAETVLSRCEVCDKQTKRMYQCQRCGLQENEKCNEHGDNALSAIRSIPIGHYFHSLLKKMKTSSYPELIKGVRGTSNKEHIPEYLLKGILRARYGVHVYKDGTTRYDMTQLPLTHIKPKEVGTSVERLKELGYTHDVKGKELVNDEQVLELKPQDIVLPKCIDALDEGAEDVLKRVASFVDDELEHVYRLPRLYNTERPEDLVGHLTVVLAPHTSAGMVGRIIGFHETQGLFAHPLLHAATRRDCDGDEACVVLLMDAFLNFSKKYLPESRGGTMDTPLVLTSILTPSEVDDMAFDLDIAWKYPLEFYNAAMEYKMPWDIKINQINHHLNTPAQYEGMGFTHDLTNFNESVKCSKYKTAPSMQEKLDGQMDIAVKLSSVDTADVARLVIEKHFLKDAKGNLRKFSMQQFRCVSCNEKFRRPPLRGKCSKCNGKIVFTIAEGSVIKYVEPMAILAEKYEVSPYLKQTIELLQRRVDEVFGREKEKQTGLGEWGA